MCACEQAQVVYLFALVCACVLALCEQCAQPLSQASGVCECVAQPGTSICSGLHTFASMVLGDGVPGCSVYIVNSSKPAFRKCVHFGACLKHSQIPGLIVAGCVPSRPTFF